MTSNNGYQIVELEDLDRLVSGVDHSLMVGILSYVVHSLNLNEELSNDYYFEVIKYGFQGYYPVIGVRSLIDDSRDLEEIVVAEYEKIVRDNTIRDFVEFSKHHSSIIYELSRRIKEQ